VTVQAHAAIATLVDISSPKGAPWEFLVVFATLLLGPVLFKRAGVPGIIGLLLGGYVIGPHGLDLIGSGNDTLPDLGQLGLLYLMFVAGVELDLNLLRRYRRSTVVFGLLTFAFPIVLGTIVGLGLGWEAKAAILLGSLLASHTLITYPTVRDAGLSSDPAAATAVGSTVLTDTLALVVLAGVAGSVGGGRSGVEVAVQIGVGLIVLIGFSLLVLPLLAGWAFRLLGAERSVRYIVAITAFLSAATVAELFGIEGIVGAFFAGLALNRLVPNEGQLMDRIEFFGGAVFIPVFLVSVGLILNPSVMVEPQTLELAGLFVVACLGGKTLAALLSARLLGFSRAQATLLFSLSSAQAAATLAATVIGFQLGLFDSSVVNAVLVLILVSVLASTITATRASERIASDERGPRPMGRRVVVGVGDPELARGALSIAVRIARADGGVVHPVLVVPESAPFAPKAARERLGRVGAAAGVDCLPTTIVDRSVLHGALRAGRAEEATLVLVSEPPDEDSSRHRPPNGGSGGGGSSSSSSSDGDTHPHAPPVAIVRGNADRLGIVRTLLEDQDGNSDDEGDDSSSSSSSSSSSVTAEMARRVAGRPADRLDENDPDWPASLAPGDVTFVSTRLGEALAELGDAGRGMVVATLSGHELSGHEDTLDGG
jgi:Kef-type K+ transport system membrane component KefB